MTLDIAATQASESRTDATGGPAPFSDRQELIDYVKLILTVAGASFADDDFHTRLRVPYEVIARLKDRIRLSWGLHSPIDRRTQAFLDRYLEGVKLIKPIRLPGLGQMLILDREGMALELSLPEHGDLFESDIVSSYRLVNRQGVLHNPKADRRTTEGVFHVTEGGHPVPFDKKSVPRETFAHILRAALAPPDSLSLVPFTAGSATPVHTLVSLMLRPLVVPHVAGVTPEMRSEIRFVVPGGLVSNLDFVERIFKNWGDPFLPEYDAALDVDGWTGHTGYVLLAPHLITLRKKDVGLPHVSEATERQKRDGMCWTDENELYNGGNAFKLTARDDAGVIVTIIADNYFGYCKKEVKTQISFAANLLGRVEEEHAGGAIVYPRFDLGKFFSVPTHLPGFPQTFDRVRELFADIMDLKPEGYGIDRNHPHIYFVPETVEIDVYKQTVSWQQDGKTQSIALTPDVTYMTPSGFKVTLQREAESGQWRLIGTTAEGAFCHKPSTVSGGGKSEISKPISDAIMHGPFFVANFEKDMDMVEMLLHRDYSTRFKNPLHKGESRPVLSDKRSMGSVIKLLTPSPTLYSDHYNKWLETIPHAIRQLVYMVKRFYREEMGENWREGFSVDLVNGRPGNELMYNGEKLVTYYARIGFSEDGSWRIFSLRSDFVPAVKLQREDDITASIVVPADRLPDTNPKYDGPVSHKIVSSENPERRLFQRPDDAIIRGYDKVTEEHFASRGNFFSNFAPLQRADAQAILAAPITFAQFTPPMQSVIRAAAKVDGYFASSAHPRIVDGKPTKNPRYLQIRPDLADPEGTYLAELGTRLQRGVPYTEPLPTPVNATLPGRRLNPPDAAAGMRSLAVYNPIHYQETPELFMEYISSLTGKSPSTTGAGSEGALTKGPFNALLPIIDINNCLVSHILTETECFVTAAGYVGPKLRVDHDVSLIVPEVWSRMEPAERKPKYLIENNYLAKCEDFDYKGQRVLASRLGYRITAHFVSAFFGIVFDNPNDIFTREMLEPELMDMESFVDGIDNIVTTQKRIADYYFADGSVERACPPIKALLHIMRDGEYEGKTVDHPEIRAMFTREALLESPWYKERLAAQQVVDLRLWERHVATVSAQLAGWQEMAPDQREKLEAALSEAKTKCKEIARPEYVDGLFGFIGVDPSVVH